MEECPCSGQTRSITSHGTQESWTIEEFERLFLDGLIEKYPELVMLRAGPERE
jgi:hypothetical protein